MIDHKLPKPANGDVPSSWLPPQRTGKRRMLWEIGGSMQCSVLGTCLGEDDLLGAIRKCGLSLQGAVTSYDIHAHCVKMATSSNVLSKALHKLLDKRYEGAVRLVSRADTEAEILALWEKLRELGPGRRRLLGDRLAHARRAGGDQAGVRRGAHALAPAWLRRARDGHPDRRDAASRHRDRGASAPCRGGPQRGAGRTRCGAYRIAGARRRSEHG